MIRAGAGLLALVLLAGGCGTTPTDYPLAKGAANQPRQSLDGDSNHTLVVMSLSGGGSRAAALAAAVVKRLDALTYAADGGQRPLAADIAVVSSVSGGSVYAADLGLHGPGHAGDFLTRVQNFDGIGWLEGRALDPLTWIRLQLDGQTRIAVLQAMIEELLQSHDRLAAFDRPGAPIILLNATDMVAGQVFTFDRDTIDDLCMDFSQVPMSLAVTASAAFPIAFTPVLLRNDSYVSSWCNQRAALSPYRTALQLPGGAYASLETYRLARYRQSLRDDQVRIVGTSFDVPPFRQPQYLRLVDGGVADNSGLTALRRRLILPGGPADLARLATERKLSNLVVIAVNARSDPPNPLDGSAAYTTIPTMATSISGTLVDSASAGAAGVFDDFITELAEDRNRSHAEFGIFPISIDFDQLPTETEEQRLRQEQVKEIATSWTLQPGDVKRLDEAAGELLWRHPCFRALVAAIGLKGREEAPAAPGVICPVPPVPRHSPT